MGATGTTTLDFTASPTVDASIAVTGQGSILAGSLVEAWIFPTATASHTADEHVMADAELVKVTAGNVSAGTGFTIYGHAKQGLMVGAFTVAWAWV